MPNWCESDLYVEGDPDELARFKEKARGPESLLDENSFIPYPEEWALLDKLNPLLVRPDGKRAESPEIPEGLLSKATIMRLKGFDLTRGGYNQGGYEWCIDHWGTKSGLVDVELEGEETQELIYSFRSAWSPPTPIIRKMGEDFPGLNFRLEYFECGVGFQGVFEMKDGVCTEDSTADYLNGDRGG